MSKEAPEFDKGGEIVCSDCPLHDNNALCNQWNSTHHYLCPTAATLPEAVEMAQGVTCQP